METQCHYLTITKCNKLLKWLQIFEELFYGTFGTEKIYPVELESKYIADQMCLRPYSVLKVHNKCSKERLNVNDYYESKK